MSVHRMIETTAYLQIKKKPSGWLRGMVVRHTAKKPEEPVGGAVVVKLVIRVPEEAFQPLSPSATVEVPLSLVQQPVEVVATDAED